MIERVRVSGSVRLQIDGKEGREEVREVKREVGRTSVRYCKIVVRNRIKSYAFIARRSLTLIMDHSYSHSHSYIPANTVMPETFTDPHRALNEGLRALRLVTWRGRSYALERYLA